MRGALQLVHAARDATSYQDFHRTAQVQALRFRSRSSPSRAHSDSAAHEVSHTPRASPPPSQEMAGLPAPCASSCGGDGSQRPSARSAKAKRGRGRRGSVGGGGARAGVPVGGGQARCCGCCCCYCCRRWLLLLLRSTRRAQSGHAQGRGQVGGCAGGPNGTRLCPPTATCTLPRHQNTATVRVSKVRGLRVLIKIKRTSCP